MSDKRTAEEWGRVAVSLPGWRWMPGMLAVPTSHPRERWLICWSDQQYTKTLDGWDGPHGWEGGGYKVDNGKVWGIGPYAGDPIDLSGDGWLPDPDDPATAGCLLALLGSSVMSVEPADDGGWLVELYDLGVYHGSSLGRACIAAAEALGRWPGGEG
jgi:hypothetical protein